jgi:hypothetical protein
MPKKWFNPRRNSKLSAFNTMSASNRYELIMAFTLPRPSKYHVTSSINNSSSVQYAAISKMALPSTL